MSCDDSVSGSCRQYCRKGIEETSCVGYLALLGYLLSFARESGYCMKDLGGLDVDHIRTEASFGMFLECKLEEQKSLFQAAEVEHSPPYRAGIYFGHMNS